MTESSPSSAHYGACPKCELLDCICGKPETGYPGQREEQYRELAAAIVKAVPEIADWVTIGTELRLDGYKHIVTSCCGEDGELGSFTTVQQMHRDELGKHFEWEADELEKFEVIIRPITLEDVLWALLGDALNYGIRFQFERGMLILGHQAATPAWGGSWHLGHDLAWHRDNAPETITFLHSLLCK